MDENQTEGMRLDVRIPYPHDRWVNDSRAAPRPKPSPAPRRATNVTLPDALLKEARAMGVNLSQACERGLADAVAEGRRERWLAENQDAMEAWNAHVAEHGLPLAAYRQF